MKYIHSLWSTPSIDKNFDNKYDEKYLIKNFYSYFLSALLIKKLGYEIELYCDKNAYDIYSLIPYDKIHIIDFDDDGISSKFWIWGKIKTHALMTEPYVHIDGDVFLFRDIIGDNLINGKFSAVVQSVENEKTIGNLFFDLYVNCINPFKNFDHGIDWEKYGCYAYNCGVVGFNDMKLKNDYTNKVKEILFDISNSNEFQYNRRKYEGMFLLAEQSLLYYVLKENNIEPFEIIPYSSIIEHGFDREHWYSTLPSKIGYSHLLGYSKYRSDIIEKIKFKIQKFFPEHSQIISAFENKYL